MALRCRFQPRLILLFACLLTGAALLLIYSRAPALTKTGLVLMMPSYYPSLPPRVGLPTASTVTTQRATYAELLDNETVVTPITWPSSHERTLRLEYYPLLRKISVTEKARAKAIIFVNATDEVALAHHLALGYRPVLQDGYHHDRYVDRLRRHRAGSPTQMDTWKRKKEVKLRQWATHPEVCSSDLHLLLQMGTAFLLRVESVQRSQTTRWRKVSIAVHGGEK